MKTDTSEKGLETLITGYLTAENGYTLRENTAYNNVTCIDEELLFNFLENSQPKAIDKIKAYHKDLYRAKIISRLNDQIQSKGILEVLRKGITDGFTDTKLQLFFDRPASAYNEQAIERYRSNIFSVMRQVFYSTANRNSLDMVVFVNGLPVITFELKNELTGQTVKNAIAQYCNDRDPNEELFRHGRLLVNFALDTEEVWMCSQLKKEKSYFLPFNKGYQNGAGNPPTEGIRTEYLWKEILLKDSLTDIIQNYGRFVTTEKEIKDAGGRVKTVKEKNMIFPRYHQLIAVRMLLKHAQTNGSGQKYLIQHSAGSGKSNSIAWLSHQLIGLHDTSGKNNVFDSVIIITDRKVLDKQIRDNIKQFQQVSGVVEAITEGSKQLKQALQEGKKIIITTIQKFPRIVEDIGELPGNNFAIIIDEAHSSLSGQMARKLNETLSKIDLHAEDEDDIRDEIEDIANSAHVDDFDDTELTGEDLIRILVKSRKMLPNASYFAFTATPKNKTLELFGQPYEEDGKTKFRAFHLYSMKQAIEERFIMDVLKYYTTYQSYYALLKKIEDDPEYDKIKAQKKLRAYVEGHAHAIQKKSALMIEHFMENVIKQKRMGGQAKAMLVTSSRANAVKYKKAFDEYLKKINTPFKAIVAFSGEIDGETETSLNHFASNQIPAEFEKNEYRFLIVANKYQTGFDQPLLHTMFVDKKLGGVNAVQTLSRLNRSHPLKQDTFVLDFANTAEDIAKAFQPYYENTVLGEATDPNKLFDLKDALDQYEIYTYEQLESFTALFQSKAPVEQLHAMLDVSAQLFRSLPDTEQQADFRAKVKTYIRLYIFLSQIVSFENIQLEQLYIYLNFLQNKLGGETPTDLAKGILENIDMDSYRLQLQSRTSIALEQDGLELKAMPTEMRGVNSNPEIDRLSNILKTFNDKYKGEFEDIDKVNQTVQNVQASIAQNRDVRDAIEQTPDNAAITIEKVLGEEIINYNNGNLTLMKLFFDNKEFKEDLLRLVTANVLNSVLGHKRL